MLLRKSRMWRNPTLAEARPLLAHHLLRWVCAQELGRSASARLLLILCARMCAEDGR